MSLHRNKLQLSNGNNRYPSQPSPKLLINHGKPNFTINRQTSSNYKKYHVDDVDSSAPQQNEFNKVILKSVQSNQQQKQQQQQQQQLLNGNAMNKLPVQHEFMEKHKIISERKIATNAEKTSTNQVQAEFLEKHRKISGGRLHLMEQNGTNGLPAGAVCGKPFIPAKPTGLTPVTPPILCNGNTKPAIPLASVLTGHVAATSTIPTPPAPPAPSKPINAHMNNTTNNSAAIPNYEQKPISSFSKDLCIQSNRYPDKVKVTKTIENGAQQLNNGILNELANLKFDIKTQNEDVVVIPVIK